MEAPSSNLTSVRKGAWTEEEDILLKKCIEKFGEGKWHQVPSRAGLNRCRKSCRLRWLNYLKPNIKRGVFAADEIDLIIRLHNLLGNRWSLIAGRLPGRTANDVKNYWNTHLLKKKLNPNLSNKRVFYYPTTTTTKSSSSYNLNTSKPNSKLIKPRPQILSKNTNFPVISSDVINNNAVAIPASNNSASSADTTSYGFINENDEIMWWEDLLMNDEEQVDSVNHINLSEPINEELGNIRTKVVEQGNYGCLDELFLDVDIWNVFNP